MVLRYTDMLNELAALGDNPNKLTDYGDAPLCLAAHRAQGLIVEKLLQNPNVNVRRPKSISCTLEQRKSTLYKAC